MSGRDWSAGVFPLDLGILPKGEVGPSEPSCAPNAAWGQEGKKGPQAPVMTLLTDTLASLQPFRAPCSKAILSTQP